jgi:hypothetical protein
MAPPSSLNDGCRTVFSKGPQLLLWAGSRAARMQITSGISPKLLRDLIVKKRGRGSHNTLAGWLDPILKRTHNQFLPNSFPSIIEDVIQSVWSKQSTQGLKFTRSLSTIFLQMY